MPLHGKVAVVTGVSRAGQIGQSVAGALAAAGARLILAARNEERVVERARELAAQGAEAYGVAVDLATETGAGALANEALARFGGLDVLVHMAGGLTVYRAAAAHSLADWEQEMGSNLVSAFLVVRACFPLLRDRGGGSVVLYGRAGLPQANMIAYNCAKAGIEAMTRTFALEGREFHIRVNAVAPGLTDTRANLESMKPTDTARWVQRTDVAAATVFLASGAAAGITGQVIQVMGKGI